MILRQGYRFSLCSDGPRAEVSACTNAQDVPILSSSARRVRASQAETPSFLSSLFFLSRVPFSLAGPALSESGFHGRGNFNGERKCLRGPVINFTARRVPSTRTNGLWSRVDKISMILLPIVAYTTAFSLIPVRF